MAEFTYRRDVNRPLTYHEMDDNLEHVEELRDDASSAADQAANARNKAQEWAESEVEPEPGSQSARTWALAAGTSAQSASDDADRAEAAVGALPEGAINDSQVSLSSVYSSQKIVNDFLSKATFDILIKDKEREAFEAATGGACTIERTPDGQPCYMHIIPRTQWEDLVPSGELGSGTHEAFIENGVEKSELLIGMYMAAEINGELVSQPRTTGRRSINWDQSVAAANAVGMSLFGNWEWSAIAFWCMSNGFQPRGNTDYGKSHSHPHERGVYDGDGNGEEYTLLGSGPNTWRHNGAPNGIADLVGNRWEWVWGFKMVDGQILLAPDNDRSLAESGWADTGWNMSGASAGVWASNPTNAPQAVRRALIMPNGVSDPGGNLWMNLEGERFPLRSGSRSSAGNAGLGALTLDNARALSTATIGPRLTRLV